MIDKSDRWFDNHLIKTDVDFTRWVSTQVHLRQQTPFAPNASRSA